MVSIWIHFQIVLWNYYRIFNVVSCDKCGKQDLHSTSVLGVFPNSKLNLIL